MREEIEAEVFYQVSTADAKQTHNRHNDNKCRPEMRDKAEIIEGD
jgi:hypothetical protein